MFNIRMHHIVFEKRKEEKEERKRRQKMSKIEIFVFGVLLDLVKG